MLQFAWVVIFANFPIHNMGDFTVFKLSPHLFRLALAVRCNDPHVTSTVEGLLMSNETGLIAATNPTITAGIPEEMITVTIFVTKQ